MSRHKKNKHLGIRHPCDQCNYKATRQDDLDRHKLRVHGSQTTTLKEDPNKHASQTSGGSDESFGNIYILCLSKKKNYYMALSETLLESIY